MIAEKTVKISNLLPSIISFVVRLFVVFDSAIENQFFFPPFLFLKQKYTYNLDKRMSLTLVQNILESVLH